MVPRCVLVTLRKKTREFLKSCPEGDCGAEDKFTRVIVLPLHFYLMDGKSFIKIKTQ